MIPTLASAVRCTKCNQPMRPSSAVQGLYWCVPCGSVARTDRAEAEEPPRPRTRARSMREMEAVALRRRVRAALEDATALNAPWHVINPLVSAEGVLSCALEIESESARKAGVLHARSALAAWTQWRGEK